MTKADIVEMLYAKVGCTKQEAAHITELFLDPKVSGSRFRVQRL